MIDIYEQNRQHKKMLSVVSTARALSEGKTVMIINPRFTLKLTPEFNQTCIEWVEPKQIEPKACVFDEWGIGS